MTKASLINCTSPGYPEWFRCSTSLRASKKSPEVGDGSGSDEYRRELDMHATPALGVREDMTGADQSVKSLDMGTSHGDTKTSRLSRVIMFL
jgi:hypothetical protein